MTDEQSIRNGDAAPAPVGVVLHQLRIEAGLTGAELGRMVEMSQSKISRIETGSTPVAPEDAGRLARALGAPADVVARLVESAEATQNRLTDMRSAAGSVTASQRSVARMEAGVREFRVFQPAVVVGLAQTSDYARAVLVAAHEVRKAAIPEADNVVIPEALSARVRRQEVLDDPDRRFFFLLTESVLASAVVAPEFMLAQIKRLRQLAVQPNVTLRIIPAAAPWTIAQLHGFELLDSKCVVIDVYNSSIITTGAQDIALYRHAFDRLDESATSDIDPILDKYRRHYRNLLD
ncbi:helix-turn-helix domain-containing protein [Paractinoplanes lichenicola]|uniref:Helix-turn-helix domain-containing protein n=1 Tax=Paractinoplanes lichenicola TaxID=2802976 RepID=A0ABS1W5D0_9ACTN|nr:helix-turn-helix transcriptional regulator [Actinoplanes lichenicola]MBL7261946.1 helix-turn-helix domain-containing protein [Actinoplanes lichenicola]